MSKEYKHLVTIEVQAMMSDDGEVYLPEVKIQADLKDIQPPKDWCDDSDTYVIGGLVPVTTTCGVIRELLEPRASEPLVRCPECNSTLIVEHKPGSGDYICIGCGSTVINQKKEG